MLPDFFISNCQINREIANLGTSGNSYQPENFENHNFVQVLIERIFSNLYKIEKSKNEVFPMSRNIATDILYL